MKLVETSAGIFTAEMSNRVSLALKNVLFLTDKNCWNVSRQSHWPRPLQKSSLTSYKLALTFAGMATFYVSCDTDYSQGVDAGQAKEQGEEPIHLGNTEHNW